MSSKVWGYMQALLRRENPLAFYIPCTAHSLNLVGVSAVDCCIDAVSFFGFVQALYTFFAATHRWTVLSDCLSRLPGKSLTLKFLSETRWSARADAVAALCVGYEEIKSALLDIGADDNQNGATRHEANCLANSMDTLETAFMSVLWNAILTRYNETSIKLQSATCDLKLAIALLESLYAFTYDLRNRFDEFESNALTASGNSDYLSVLARPRKRTRHFDEMKGTDVVLQGRDKFRVETFIVIVNQLQTSLRGRIDAYKDVRKVFIVIAEFHVLDNDQLREHAQTLAVTYSTDLEPSMSCDEMVQFVHFA